MPNNILITPGSASIQFSGSTDNIIRLQVQPSGVVDFISQSISLLSINTRGIITSGSIAVTDGVTGSLFGTSSWANNSTSSSFAVSASWAPSAGGGITSLTAGDGLTGGTIISTGTITVDTGSVHFLDGVKKELNSEGVISSSIQINTGSFSGSFAGTLAGTSSWATNAVTASYFTGSITFPSGLIVTGSILATTVSASSFIGPLTGTASFATSASFAISSSRSVTSSFAFTSSLAQTAVLAQTASFFDGFITFPAGLDITGSLIVTGSQSITGSLNVTSGITGSLLGSSSFATTASFAVSASWAPSAPGGGVTSITAGDGLTGGTITSTGTITVDTGSTHFLDGVKKELNTEGVVSSSSQISYTGISNVPSGIVSSSTFSSPSQGTVRAVINGAQTDVDTGLQTGDSPQFTNLTVSSVITASIVSASTAITASNLRLNGLTDTTATNKVLVLNTATNQVFTTASIGAGGAGNGFPYDGRTIPAVISGSLIISSSINSPVIVSGSVNDFFELEVVNLSAGNNASSDVVVSSNDTTDFGNYIDLGINSTTYSAGVVGGPSDGYLYLTSSVGELHVGHAATSANSNVRLFAGGPSSDATTRIFISASGNVGIGTTTNLRNTLAVNGSVSASSMTGSFTGSFTGALTHFNPSTLKITVGTTAPSSPAINDLWIDTN